jgi:hypothetical protein
VEFPGQEDILKSNGNIPESRLPADAQLILGGLQAYLGRPNGLPPILPKV